MNTEGKAIAEVEADLEAEVPSDVITELGDVSKDTQSSFFGAIWDGGIGTTWG